MKKENFATLILGTIGGILFAIGMCMCLLPEWNAFTQGVVVSAIGLVVLLVMLIVRRKMEGKPAIRVTGKAVATAALSIVGVIGIVLLLCLSLPCFAVAPQGRAKRHLENIVNDKYFCRLLC